MSSSSPIEGRRWTLVGRVLGPPGNETPTIEVLTGMDGPLLPPHQKVEVMPVEEHEAAMNNATHERNYWSWKYERREAECEELADRLRAAEEALGPFAALAKEVDRLRHSDDSTCPHRLKAGDIRRAASLLSTKAGEAAGGDAEDCKRCGRSNVIWSAMSPLWNAVIRGGSINGEPKYDDMVCPTCFMQLAEEQGIASHFRVTADEVSVELEMVTPSGRVWDAERSLWVAPADTDANPIGDREQLQELAKWVDDRLGDHDGSGIFGGSGFNGPKPGLELVRDHIARIRDEQKAGS